MNDLNSRHLKLINELIQSFKDGNIEFSHFVNRFEVLIESFENPPQLWIKKVRLKWEELEIINAILLDEHNTSGKIDKIRPKILSILNNISELTGSSFTKEEAFKSLVNLEFPTWQLKTILDRVPLENEQMVLMTKFDVKAILTKFVHDKVQLPILNEWAKLIESREEIGYDSSGTEQIKQLIFELANPNLHTPFTKERALEWISILER